MNGTKKENHVQLVNIPDILAELQIADDDYSKALSIPKDDNLELHVTKKSKLLLCKQLS